MANKSQTGLGLRDVSAVMTGHPVLVAAEDAQRGALEMMNTQAADILIWFAPLGRDNTVVPADFVAGAAGLYTLAAAGAGKQGGSYEPQGGFIPCNAIWAQGTNTQILAAHVSP